MSTNMKQLEHGSVSNLPAKRLETAGLLLQTPVPAPEAEASFSDIWGS